MVELLQTMPDVDFIFTAKSAARKDTEQFKDDIQSGAGN